MGFKKYTGIRGRRKSGSPAPRLGDIPEHSSSEHKLVMPPEEERTPPATLPTLGLNLDAVAANAAADAVAAASVSSVGDDWSSRIEPLGVSDVVGSLGVGLGNIMEGIINPNNNNNNKSNSNYYNNNNYKSGQSDSGANSVWSDSVFAGLSRVSTVTGRDPASVAPSRDAGASLPSKVAMSPRGRREREGWPTTSSDDGGVSPRSASSDAPLLRGAVPGTMREDRIRADWANSDGGPRKSVAKRLLMQKHASSPSPRGVGSYDKSTRGGNDGTMTLDETLNSTLNNHYGLGGGDESTFADESTVGSGKEDARIDASLQGSSFCSFAESFSTNDDDRDDDDSTAAATNNYSNDYSNEYSNDYSNECSNECSTRYTDYTYSTERTDDSDTRYTRHTDEYTIDSYMDDGTSYLSDDDSECSDSDSDDTAAGRAAGYAPERTWASWLGFGGEQEERSTSPEKNSSGHPPQTDLSDDSQTFYTRDTATANTNKDDDETLREKKTSSKRSALVHFNRVIESAKDKKASVAANRRAEVAPAEKANVHRGAAEKNSAALKKKWQRLREAASTGNGKQLQHRRDHDDNVSRMSENTPATAASSRAGSMGRTASKSNYGADVRGMDGDMRQRDIYCSKRGSVDNLSIRQYSDVSKPGGPDHVVVKVLASTVSSGDCLARLKGGPEAKPSPAVPGHHIVGQIHAIGDKVKPSKFLVGSGVAALLPEGGGNAKYISIPKGRIILLPNDDDQEGVICLLASYMTAYQCLKLAKKDGAPLTFANVLIAGGSGPVGQAMVELALQEGAKVYTTAHRMHEEHLTKLGAQWFSVRPKKWLPKLESKMDVVIDNLCVDGYESSYRALTTDGILVCNTGNHSEHQIQRKSDAGFGISIDQNGVNGVNEWWSSVKARYMWNRAIFYDVNESYEKNPRAFGHELQYLLCKLHRGELSPKVAGKVSLNQIPKAQKLVEKGLPNGTVICLPWKKLDPKQNVKVEKPDHSR